jgi:CBS domain-containing protein
MAIHELSRPALEVAPDRSVLDAVRLMAERRVGAATVTRDGQPIGIFTERDLLRRVVLEGRDSSRTAVSEVMTSPVDTVPAHTTIEEAVTIMRSRHHRHLAVIDDRGRLSGIVSLRYLLYHLMDQADRKVDSLEAQLMADAPGG